MIILRAVLSWLAGYLESLVLAVAEVLAFARTRQHRRPVDTPGLDIDGQPLDFAEAEVLCSLDALADSGITAPEPDYGRQA